MFASEDLQLLHRTDEVGMETRPGRQVPIWIVVDGDQAYVRSVKGPNGAWWKRLSSGGEARLHAGGRSWAIRGEPVSDAQVQRVSDALKSKYERRWPGPTAAMLRPDTLPTTLRLQPA
jgi:hypothetical protein